MKLAATISALLLYALSFCQETMYIPVNSTVYVGSQQSIGVFGNFINDGNLSIPANGKVYFLGKIFKNHPTALLTDSSTLTNSKKAGNIIFQQPHPSYGYIGQQILEAGYRDNLHTGPSFSNITINNIDGITLTSDLNVLDAVNFQKGHVYLNNYSTVLGDSASYGGVNGYSEKRYFVTGTGITGGSLKIRALQSCCIVTYPVGPDNAHYTPLQLRNTGELNDIYVRAFSNVYRNATSGDIITDTTLKVTWAVATSRPGNTDIEVHAQNDKDVETPTFSTFRDKSYISLFRNNAWDKLGTFSPSQSPGTITSSAAIYTAMMNFRKISVAGLQYTYFTKSVVPSTSKYLVANAFSPNGDGINDVWNLHFLSAFPLARVEIFNRYGQVLFTSYGYKKPWDGMFKGKPLPVGTYYYVINLRNGEPPLTGYVVLLR